MNTQNNSVTHSKVCLISWNSRGSSTQKLQFAKYLVSPEVVGDKIPILCNQENFILKNNSYRLFQAIPGFQFFINPAVKNVQDCGRPRNGMFICVPDSIRSSVTDVSPGHWRVQAIVIKSNHSRTLIINTYFPTDTRQMHENQQNESDELAETLSNIQNVIRNTECDNVVWAGDINADFRRNTRHCSTVMESVMETNLAVTWDRFHVDFTHTFEREGTTHVSTLDHFFVSENLMSNVIDAGVVHHLDNTSDHEPIFCTFTSITTLQCSAKPAPRQPRPSWQRATEGERESYVYLVDTRLRSVMVPTQVSECRDVHCKDEVHIEALEWYTAEVLEAVQSAAETSLPCPRVGGGTHQHSKISPGFSEKVKPFKETAYFWHSVWKSAGRPINTELHKLMKKTRNRYHMENKKCQKAELTIKKSKLLDACLNGNGDLFREIKAMRKTKPKFADSMDGVTKNIPGHFKEIYKDLYNCVQDADEVSEISNTIEQKIKQADLKDVDKVTPEEVKKAAMKLKPGKADPTFSFSSDCLRSKSRLLPEHTAMMMKAFLIHNHIPQFMLLSTLIPIIKDKLSSFNVSKNYRSVCISSLFLKQLDWIMIHLFGDSLSFHDLQFAYQPDVSATMCSWAVVETVNYFLRNGSEVFGCSMDKSKAFDLCKFSVLFRKMMTKISLIFLRLIIFTYVHQFSNISYNSEVSSSFTISNGVGQGKILAGFAFCFYCFELFDILKNSGFGCHVSGVYAGILGFSDDELLLSPTVSGLQEMIKLTETYCQSHGLKFSTDPDPRRSKTKCISWLHRPRQLPMMRLCNNSLPWVNKILHLGNTITNEVQVMKKDTQIKNARYVAKNIEINQEFHFAAYKTRLEVNAIYNSSWYGSVIWDLFCPAVTRIESSYNRSVKIMMDLPYGTHRSMIEPLSNRRHLKIQLIRRFLKMIEKMKISKKPILRTLLSLTQENTQSSTGRNLRHIMLLTDRNNVSDLVPSDADTIEYFTLEDEDSWKIEMLECMLVEREQGNLGDSDQELFEWLCTD